MFKIIKRKLANYLYGVNIEDLIDKNNLNLKEVEKLHSQNKHLVISLPANIKHFKNISIERPMRILAVITLPKGGAALSRRRSSCIDLSMSIA